MRNAKPPSRVKRVDGNAAGERFWWMDPQEPRFRSSPWAKLAYAVVWAAGLMFLIWIAQIILYLLTRRG